jgi:Flp pilus assembly protein TadG
MEFACCLPLMVLILTGLWEVGRIMQVQTVMMNSAREAARDSSIGQDSLAAVAGNLLTYLQSAEPSAFGVGHSTSLISPVVTMPANTTGYTVWDSTANQELFTMTFSDLTNTSISDPTLMSQLDVFTIGVQVPYNSIKWSSLVPVNGANRLTVSVTWASMVDSPFQIAPNLPAQ